MRILIDTNVVIDYLLQRQGYEWAKTILELGLSDNNMEYVTATTITDVSFLVGKYSVPKMDSFRVQDSIRDVLKIIDILPVSREDIEYALDLRWKDMEDALQYSVAIANDCDCIITNNVKDFELNEIEVINPSEFITKYNPI